MTDPEFGELYITINTRATRFTFRPAEGGMKITVPKRWKEAELIQAIEEMRPRLRLMFQRADKKKDRQTDHFIDWNFQIQSECLSFSLAPDATLKPGQFSLHKEMGHITILCPPEIDFNVEGRQEFLVKVIEEQVRSYAKGMLPAQLRALSKEFDLPISSIHINSSHGRWGSCSRKVHRVLGILREDSGYNINLSLYVLLLPRHLQRLIMLHELTHTLEMNHSPRFHAKLNAMLGGTEAALEKEIKRYSTNIFAFSSSKRAE